MLPVNQIRPTVEETWAGIKAMCMEIGKEFAVEQSNLAQAVPQNSSTI